MAATAKLKGDRKWTVNMNGSITSLTRRYLIVRDTLPSGTTAEEITSITGLPALKSAHSTTHDLLLCDGYSFAEGTENGKQVLYCDVSYSLKSSAENEANSPNRGAAIEAIGWRSGTVARDLVCDAKTGAALVNTAGQPFDSVPQVDMPAPTFTKVLKTMTRQAWASYFGKVNTGAITVGGIQCAARCLRCVQVDEERLWADDFGYQYKYTVGLQLMSNLVKLAGANVATEIGWDVAVVSAGTMERKTANAAATPIEIPGGTTGKPTFASSPILLDGDGKAMLAQGSVPYSIRFQAYADTTFPSDFYSEPT